MYAMFDTSLIPTSWKPPSTSSSAPDHTHIFTFFGSLVNEVLNSSLARSASSIEAVFAVSLKLVLCAGSQVICLTQLPAVCVLHKPILTSASLSFAASQILTQLNCTFCLVVMWK